MYTNNFCQNNRYTLGPNICKYVSLYWIFWGHHLYAEKKKTTTTTTKEPSEKLYMLPS